MLSRLFAVFNRGFETATRGYVRVSHGLVRKAFPGIALLAGFTVLAAGLGRRLPTSFVPEEDYGYFLLTLQLPPAASLERTDAVCRKIDQLLAHTEGIANFNTIAGFSLLSRVTADNYGFYFVGLTPWEERTRADLDARQIVNSLNGELRRIVPEATAFAVMPPSIPGLGTQGGLSFWLQDRTGGSLEFLNQNVQAVLDAARKRPSGAVSGRILGTVVVTGMLAATALAIFVVPLLFVLTERLASRFTRQAHAGGPAPAPLEGEV